MFRRASAITPPGIALAQPPRTTRPAKPLPRATSSIESAITSRLTSDARIPSLPIVMPSEIETVLNSIGVPAAARMPSLTCAASSRIGDHLAAHERRAHPLAAHRDAVGDRDGVELHRRAAGGADAALDVRGELAQVG